MYLRLPNHIFLVHFRNSNHFRMFDLSNKSVLFICPCCFALFNDSIFHKNLQHISHQFIHVMHVREHNAASLIFCQQQLKNTTNKIEKLKFGNRKLVIDSLLSVQKAFQSLLTFLYFFPVTNNFDYTVPNFYQPDCTNCFLHPSCCRKE